MYVSEHVYVCMWASVCLSIATLSQRSSKELQWIERGLKGKKYNT